STPRKRPGGTSASSSSSSRRTRKRLSIGPLPSAHWDHRKEVIQQALTADQAPDTAELSRSRRRRRRPKACSQEIVRSTNQRNPPSPLLRIPTRGSRVARHAICQGINTLRPRRHRTCSCALHLENILDFASEGPLNRPEIDNP